MTAGSRRVLLEYVRGELSPFETAVLGAASLEYAIGVARRVAGFGSYERGFRPAGSDAARRCAEYLAGELEAAGVPQVEVMEYPLDGWDFAGAHVEVEGAVFEAVAYGGACGTPPEGLAGELVDCGRGAADDYAGVDVRGKIALVEMDLELINWPGVALLEAAHHGAVGVVCWPARGYAMLPGSFHCHDLQAYVPIPMVNVTRDDGRCLRQYRRARIISTARLLPGATGRNVVGIIPGSEVPDELVIIGDHYDAWFDGFMDDAVGVGAVVALARAVVASGVRPRRTLVFVLHDAEEFGQSDSAWDWCTGAFAQISRLRPDWAGRAVAAVIFELCGFKDAPTYEWYVSPELGPLADDVIDQVPAEEHYALGKRVNRLVSTWEDAFSYTAAGIPSAANLEIPEYVRSHYYHTQFDTEELLDPDKYGLHAAGLGLLALRVCEARVAPLDFAARAFDLRNALPPSAPDYLIELVQRLERIGLKLDHRLAGLAAATGPGAASAGPAADGPAGASVAARLAVINRMLLEAAGILNRGLTWVGGESADETLYPHEQPFRDLAALKEGDLRAVTGMGWGQNVSYPVYRRQLFRHMDEPGRCWQWASGRVSPYVDVWQMLQQDRPPSQQMLRAAKEALDAAYRHEAEVLTRALAVLERM